MSYPGPPYYPPEYDAPTVYFEKLERRRARYPHRCYACSQPIQPGQTYSRIFAIVDGEPQVQKWHGVTIGECMTAEEREDW